MAILAIFKSIWGFYEGCIRKMKIGQIINKMKQDAINYHDDIQEYVCITQCTFSACLCLFFLLHIVMISILDFADYQKLNVAIWISFLQMFFSLIWYLLFRYYFSSHKKHILTAAYLNIFQVTTILELQYFFYDDFISYTVIVCIILCTSLTVIGHIRKYLSIITLICISDIIATIIKNYTYIHSYYMHMYIIDTLFIVVIAVVINICFSRLKYQDFAKKQQILYFSERDSLTGLLNRKALEYSVQKHIKNNTLCALILLDLDNFKKLNDTLGHYEGDNCLCAVANALKQLFGQNDCVSRLGGDEFVIFMPHISDIDFVTEKTNAILKNVPRKYPYETGQISITCSIGVAFSKSTQNDLYEKLYKAADTAM